MTANYVQEVPRPCQGRHDVAVPWTSNGEPVADMHRPALPPRPSAGEWHLERRGL